MGTFVDIDPVSAFMCDVYALREGNALTGKKLFLPRQNPNSIMDAVCLRNTL